jgi:hypothetical protein
LARQWSIEAEQNHQPTVAYSLVTALATRAAQWGADQQLAKDAEWLDHNALNEPHLRITPMGESLKEAMRPKPPSLKEEASAAFEQIVRCCGDFNYFEKEVDTIRRALEALPND